MTYESLSWERKSGTYHGSPVWTHMLSIPFSSASSGAIEGSWYTNVVVPVPYSLFLGEWDYRIRVISNGPDIFSEIVNLVWDPNYDDSPDPGGS